MLSWQPVLSAPPPEAVPPAPVALAEPLSEKPAPHIDPPKPEFTYVEQLQHLPAKHGESHPVPKKVAHKPAQMLQTQPPPPKALEAPVPSAEKTPEKEAEAEEAAGRSGDQLALVKNGNEEMVVTDQKENRLVLPTAAISDRNVGTLQQTRMRTSTQRGVGDGKGTEEKVSLKSDLYTSSAGTAALKRGEAKAHEAGQSHTAPLPQGQHRQGEVTTLQAIVLPAMSRYDIPSKNIGLELLIEPPPPPQPTVVRRHRQPPAPLPPKPKEDVPSSTPIPDATPVFADAERPHYFDDGFSLIPEPAAEKGDDVPVLLTKPQSELESGSTAAYGALEIVDDDILLGDASAIATRKTELGVWAVGFDAQVRKAWVYPPELRALGINGVVTLEFTVLPSGRVIDIHAQSSSMEELIIPSAAAIPEQAEPLPKDKAFRKGIHFSYTFRYGETS